MKLTWAVLKLIPEASRGAFKQVDATKKADDDATEYDNGEEDAGALANALKAEKEEKAKIKAKLDAADAAKASEIEAAKKKALEDARANGDFAAIEKDYKDRLAAMEKEKKDMAKAAEDRKKSDALDKAADEVANMFTVPKAMKAFVRERLSVDLVEGEPIVRVLKDGKASGLSLADLKNEYLTDKDLKGSIAASKASGGGSGGAPPSGGSGGGNNDKPFDAATADPKSMIAHLEAKGAVKAEGDDD